MLHMSYRPDDNRALFQRVVDDICNQIRTGELKPEDRVPSAKQISDKYGIASMTAQRALRELQGLGLTYGIPGKGSFVRPDAVKNLPILDITDDRTYIEAVTRWATSGDDILDEMDAAIAAGDMKRIQKARDAFADYMSANARQVLAADRYYRQTQAEGREIEGRDQLRAAIDRDSKRPRKRAKPADHKAG